MTRCGRLPGRKSVTTRSRREPTVAQANVNGIEIEYVTEGTPRIRRSFW